MQSINTNLSSLFGQWELSSAQSALGQSVERLSSGLRINRAKDDAAGLGISQELQRQTRSFAVATRNANDAISMVQTAEGAMQSVSDMLIRLKELTTQGANESLSKEQRSFITGEINKLRKEINAVAERTTFNNSRLLTGDFSEAQRGQFHTATSLTPGSKTALEPSTIEAGDSSVVVAGKSTVKFDAVIVENAADGTYELTNDGATLTLKKTSSVGVVSRQSLTLTSGTPTSKSQVSLSQTAGGITTLNFSELGVELRVANTTVGSDHTASEIATKITSIGIVENLDRKNKGWTAVAGADWASGSGTLKAVITSSGGQIRTTSVLSLSAVAGYAGDGSIGGTTGGTLGSSLFNSTTGRYEMALQGSATHLNAALRTLQVDNTTGIGDVIVEIVPEKISVFTNPDTGVTSYYEVKDSTDINWDVARAAALNLTRPELGLSADYDNGYLANVTSTKESEFLKGKVKYNGWIGASDWYVSINNAITDRNSQITAGVLTGTGNAYAINATSYANQAAAEGKWYWIDGPERGLQFQNGNVSLERIQLVSGGVGQVSTAYADWARSAPFTNVPIVTNTDQNIYEPNNSDGTNYTYPGGILADGEHYAYLINGGSWNDFSIGNDSVDAYVVEYGGYAGVFGNTSKTILLGKAGTIAVGSALELSGVTTNNAQVGIYKVSSDETSKTVTLRRFDVDGETLLQTETIDISDQNSLGVGQKKTFDFAALGIQLDVRNLAEHRITLGSAQSGLKDETVIASSRMASLIGADGPKFQTGEASRNEFAVSAFKDMRLGKNTDSAHGELFNEVNDLILSTAASSDPATASFQRLENKVDDMITVVTARLSDFGAIQNRLTAAINNINEQFANLTAAKSQIQDTDFAWETARLTKLQIGQQAATAMLAQANAIPNVIMALIE